MLQNSRVTTFTVLKQTNWGEGGWGGKITPAPPARSGLIPVVIMEIFNPIAEYAIYTGKLNNETKVEIQTQAVTIETVISKCSMSFKNV